MELVEIRDLDGPNLFQLRPVIKVELVTSPGERVADAYGILGPPETYFIARDGTIAARQFGPVDADSLEAQLATILHDHEE